MACPNGSQPKQGTPEYIWMNPGDVLTGDSSGGTPWYGNLLNNLVNWAEPSADFCASPPPGPDTYNFVPNDFGLGQIATAISKAQSYVKAHNWNKHCECLPS